MHLLQILHQTKEKISNECFKAMNSGNKTLLGDLNVILRLVNELLELENSRHACFREKDCGFNVNKFCDLLTEMKHNLCDAYKHHSCNDARKILEELLNKYDF